jgi:hypothetical protein
MFVANANCMNCLRVVEVNIDTSEGVPSRVGIECGNCGAVNHFVLNWAPRVWITDRAGFDVPAVAQSNKSVKPTVSTLRGPVTHITDEDIDAINLI